MLEHIISSPQWIAHGETNICILEKRQRLDTVKLGFDTKNKEHHGYLSLKVIRYLDDSKEEIKEIDRFLRQGKYLWWMRNTLMHKKKTTFNQNHSHRKDPHRRHATARVIVLLRV